MNCKISDVVALKVGLPRDMPMSAVSEGPDDKACVVVSDTGQWFLWPMEKMTQNFIDDTCTMFAAHFINVSKLYVSKANMDEYNNSLQWEKVKITIP